MTIITVGIPRTTWLSLVTPDVRSRDLRRELDHPGPDEDVIILGFKNTALEPKLIARVMPSEGVMNTFPFVGTGPKDIIEQFVGVTSYGHFLQEFQGARRIIMPYEIGAFMAALWGIGVGWDSTTFLAEWEVLMDNKPLPVGSALSPMSTMLGEVFQARLNDKSAPNIADALSKIVSLSQSYNAAVERSIY